MLTKVHLLTRLTQFALTIRDTKINYKCLYCEGLRVLSTEKQLSSKDKEIFLDKIPLNLQMMNILLLLNCILLRRLQLPCYFEHQRKPCLFWHILNFV